MRSRPAALRSSNWAKRAPRRRCCNVCNRWRLATRVLLDESKSLAAEVRDFRLGLEISVIQSFADKIVRLLKVRDPLCERVHLNPVELLAFSLGGVAARVDPPPHRASPCFRNRRLAHDARDRCGQSRLRDDSVRQFVLCRDAHASAGAAGGDVSDLQLLPSGRRHRRFRRTAPAAAGRAATVASRISTRSIRAVRRRGCATTWLRSSVSDWSARIFSRSSTAWKWMSRRISARRIFATLDLYCDRVASAVGRLSVRVFGMPRDDGVALAHHLGRALQLTNILRDIDEDAAIGRLYLPKESLAQAGITSTDPLVVAADPALPKVCASLVATAEDHFAKSDEIMARNSRGAVRAPRIMSKYYGAILQLLVARGFANPRTPVRVNKIASWPSCSATDFFERPPFSDQSVTCKKLPISLAREFPACRPRSGWQTRISRCTFTRRRSRRAGAAAPILTPQPISPSITAITFCCRATTTRWPTRSRSAPKRGWWVRHAPSFPFVDLRSGKRWQLDLGDSRLPLWVFDSARRVPDTTLARLSGADAAGLVVIGKARRRRHPLRGRAVRAIGATAACWRRSMSIRRRDRLASPVPSCARRCSPAGRPAGR